LPVRPRQTKIFSHRSVIDRNHVTPTHPGCDSPQPILHLKTYFDNLTVPGPAAYFLKISFEPQRQRRAQRLKQPCKISVFVDCYMKLPELTAMRNNSVNRESIQQLV